MRFVSVAFALTLCFLGGVAFGTQTAVALDPGGDTLDCMQDGTQVTQDQKQACAYVLCSWDNVARNWPDDTGYKVDCAQRLVRIADFTAVQDDGSCEALTPQCGYCPGYSDGSGCYLTQAEFLDYHGEYPEIKADELVRDPRHGLIENMVDAVSESASRRVIAGVALVLGLGVLLGAWRISKKSKNRRNDAK